MVYHDVSKNGYNKRSQANLVILEKNFIKGLRKNYKLHILSR